MKRRLEFVFASVLTIFLVQIASHSQQKPSVADEVKKGQYLVNEVAKCSECHTPRDENNQLDQDRLLAGAPIWIQPVRPMPNWGEYAPALAGLSEFSDAQAKLVLEMGEGAGGTAIEPPMHTYHMNDSDAQAVIAYLRSLPPPKVH